MATVVTPPAESAAPAPNFEPSTYTTAEHTAWMEKGTIPESKPAASTPAKDPAGAEQSAEVVSTESATAAQPNQQEQKGRGAARNADERKAELNAEIRDLLAQRNGLRAELAPKKDVAADPSPAKAKLDKPAQPTWGEPGHEGEEYKDFEARQYAHIGALARYEAAQLLQQERETAEQQRLAATTAEANRAIEESWNSRVEAAKSKHADFAEVAFSKDVPISPTMDGFVLDSDVGPEILYYLGQHVDEAKGIAAMPPYKAARALVKIESAIGDAAPAQPKTTPVQPITKAARPATDLRATQAAPVDEMKAAIEADDYTRYEQLANERDIARRKRG